VPRNQIGDFGGIRAFHSHQHHADIAKSFDISRQRQRIRCDLPVKALEARQVKPVGPDFLDHPRARQQGDAAAGQSKHAADKAADAAGAGYPDRFVRDHPAVPSFDLKLDNRLPVRCLFDGRSRRHPPRPRAL
jgi:hypothetical protein